jgi:hypothetical protein
MPGPAGRETTVRRLCKARQITVPPVRVTPLVKENTASGSDAFTFIPGQQIRSMCASRLTYIYIYECPRHFPCVLCKDTRLSLSRDLLTSPGVSCGTCAGCDSNICMGMVLITINRDGCQTDSGKILCMLQ